jgi:hypothetical protein
MPSIDPADLEQRACNAYLRLRSRDGARAMQPSRGATTVERIGDITYVAVRNSYELLAVYKVLPSGRLKGLEDWPEQLGERA